MTLTETNIRSFFHTVLNKMSFKWWLLFMHSCMRFLKHHSLKNVLRYPVVSRFWRIIICLVDVCKPWLSKVSIEKNCVKPNPANARARKCHRTSISSGKETTMCFSINYFFKMVAALWQLTYFLYLKNRSID